MKAADMPGPGESFFTEYRTQKFRGEEFRYRHRGIRDAQGCLWTTTLLDNGNYNQIFNQYRIRHNIPFPADLVAMREHYGVTAAMMSRILGFGTNQWRLYEEGEVPSESNARVIVAAAEANTFIRFLQMATSEIEAAKREKIQDNAVKAGDYTISHPSESGGYATFNPAKCSAIVNRIVSDLGETYVTKLNKILFYVDFLNYKRSGFGMTGLRYRAVQYGPVPSNYMKLYGSLTGIETEERLIGDGGGTVIKSHGESDEFVLSESELECIDEVCRKFKDFNSTEISEYSHQEEAWAKHQANHEVIPYSEAFSLSLS